MPRIPEQKSNRKEGAASSRNKLVEILLKIKRLAKDFWDFPEITVRTIKNLASHIHQMPELLQQEKNSLFDFTDAWQQQYSIDKKLIALARAYARVIKQYQDERRKNHVSIHIFSDNSVADDFPDTNNVGIIDHTALREWVDTMIEPLYTKGSNLKLVVEPINASYKNVNRDERLRRAATDLICAEKDLHTSRELFERDGVELLRLKTETQRKIDEYQRACTHGATSQFCYLYKHTIPLEQYKCSVLRLRDALIPAVTKILIFLIDADEDRLKLYARTLENALAWLTPLEQT